MSSKNTQLKKIVKNYYDDYDATCRISREERLKELRAGDPIPPEGRLYGKYKEQFQNRAYDYRNQAMKIIDDELNTINNELAKAPSTEAVNSISLLALRNHSTKKDFDNLLNVYGDNYQAFTTLKDLAIQKDIIPDLAFTEHPTVIRKEMVEIARNSLFNSLWENKTSDPDHNTEGYKELLNITIDNAFEPDPEF